MIGQVWLRGACFIQTGNFKLFYYLKFKLGTNKYLVIVEQAAPTCQTHSIQQALNQLTPNYHSPTQSPHPHSLSEQSSNTSQETMQSRRAAAKQFKDYQNPKKNNQFSPSPIKRYVSSKSFSHHYSQATQLENLNKENSSSSHQQRVSNLGSAPSFTQTRGRRKPLQQLFNELKSSHSLEPPSLNSDDEKVDINRKVSELLRRERRAESFVAPVSLQPSSLTSQQASSLLDKAIAATTLTDLRGEKSYATRSGVNSGPTLAISAKQTKDRVDPSSNRKDSQSAQEKPQPSKGDSAKGGASILGQRFQKKRALKLQGKRVESLVSEAASRVESPPPIACSDILNQPTPVPQKVDIQDSEMKLEAPAQEISSSTILQPAIQSSNKGASVAQSLKKEGDSDEMRDFAPKDMDIQMLEEVDQQQIDPNHSLNQSDESYQSQISSGSRVVTNQIQESKKPSSAMSPSSQASQQEQVQFLTPRQLITALDGQRPLNINLTQNTLIMPHPSNPNAMQYSGRWTDEEHEKFLEGLRIYGKDWRLIEEFIGSRTCAQIRSHAQKYFNKLHRNQAKRAQKLLMAEKTLGKRPHHQSSAAQSAAKEKLVADVALSQYASKLSEKEKQQPVKPFQISHQQPDFPKQSVEIVTQATEIKQPIVPQFQRPQTQKPGPQIDQQLLMNQAQSQPPQPSAIPLMDVETELCLTLRQLIAAREKVSLDFMLKKISSVDACKVLIQITNEFHEQAMKSLRNCLFDHSNRMVDERNLTQFICILLSKQVQILPPSQANGVNPEEEILQHVTASQVSLVDDENAYPIDEQSHSTLKRPRLTLNQESSLANTIAGTQDLKLNQTPEMALPLHLRRAGGRVQQPNFNLLTRGTESVTPFKSLTKTPNPIHRLLPEEFKLSGLKSREGGSMEEPIEAQPAARFELTSRATERAASSKAKANLSSVLGINFGSSTSTEKINSQ